MEENFVFHTVFSRLLCLGREQMVEQNLNASYTANAKITKA